MDQTNTTTPPPINPIAPQPLNTGPTEMPMGVPMQPAGGVSTGLPADLPQTGPVKSGGSKKMIMIVLIVIVIIVLLGVGGYYFYSMQQQTPSPTDQETTSVTDPELTDLQEEADSVVIPNPQDDFVAINEEIVALDSTASATASSSAKPKVSP